MLHNVVTAFCGCIMFIIMPVTLSSACNLILISLGVHGVSSPEDREKYRKFKQHIDKGVVLFTHPTFFDHIVIMKELNDIPRFVTSSKYMIGSFIKYFARRCNVLQISTQTGSKSSAVISDCISNRKNGEPLLAISPTAGISHTTEQETLAVFRTGAFLQKPAILPIIIKYTPYEPWLSSLTLYDIIMKRLRGRNINYTMKILDVIYPIENETPSDFAQRCRETMEQGMRDTNDKLSYNGSPLLLSTSFLFLICSYISRSNGMYGFGMLIVFVTSVLYHGTGNDMWKKVDVCSNILLGSIFSIKLLISRQWIPVVCTLITLCSYIWKLDHAIFIHIPLCIGFLSIR